MKSRGFHFFFHHQLMMFTSIMALLLKLRISFLFFLELYPRSGDEYIYVRMLLMLLKKGKGERRYNKKGFNTRAKNHCQRFKLAISPYLWWQFGYVTLFLSTPGTFAFDEMRIDNFRCLAFQFGPELRSQIESNHAAWTPIFMMLITKFAAWLGVKMTANPFDV